MHSVIELISVCLPTFYSRTISALRFGLYSFTFLIFLPSLSSCDSSGGEGNGHVDKSLPEFFVAEIRDLGTIENSAEFSSRDCGFSAIYEGKSVWVFGDTLLTLANENNQRLLCNSWSYTYDIDAGDGIAAMRERADAVGAPTPLIKLTEEEHLFNTRHAGQDCMEPPCGARWAIWPASIVVHPTGNPAYIFYHKVKTKPGSLDFVRVGHSIAVWNNYAEPTERPRFSFSETYPTLIFPSEEDGTANGFGSAALMQGQILYVYGCEFDKELYASPCLLARVHIDSILDRSKWRFLVSGGKWSSELADTASVFEGGNMTSVFYSSYISRYIAVYSQPVSTEVMYRTSVRPEGPWSGAQKLFDAEMPVGGIGWVYDALAHPEFSQDNGRIFYVTYSRTTGPMQSEFHLMAVELALAN